MDASTRDLGTARSESPHVTDVGDGPAPRDVDVPPVTSRLERVRALWCAFLCGLG